MAIVYLCDLCYMDGDEKRAIARYWSADGDEWLVCRKCLTLVEEAELEHEMLESSSSGPEQT